MDTWTIFQNSGSFSGAVTVAITFGTYYIQNSIGTNLMKEALRLCYFYVRILQFIEDN